ncbi:hypothetical protein GCM10009789_87820 [Kribbella sancticallisti]|uniref:Uncharacterized protein n=1 Tax=Kribbella sancticallisti TaxID=460087 RepID=A0ABP4QTT1_9ACTN
MSRPNAEQVGRFKAAAQARRATPTPPPEEKREPLRGGGALGRLRQSVYPDIDIDNPLPTRKRPMQERTPQGDVTRDDQNWSALDKAIDEATAEANEMLNVLGEVLDREATLATAERERANEMARTLPALGGNR